MKIFVTGVGGQLGHDVVNNALERGHQVCGSDIAEKYSGIMDGSPVTKCSYRQLDITDKDAVESLITDLRPDAIIHCAAWTAVDAAENEANKPKVHAINADGTMFIAEAAKSVDAKMIYISTDYVFDGKGDRPWQPDDKSFVPLNYYGETKLAGEKAKKQWRRRWRSSSSFASPGCSVSMGKTSSRR